ncbi:flocculation protein FLO11 isoform X1 [Rhagoletis pomonella]|uniref:flocculation protein FLO11 isoform X1 n=1 Tax=Rhagoletis pomonella TaxID=28610 RepID=UPI001781D39F|nr:flocculation protein FLO11 isoform X1 [Rhagoletis pomonella]XP_036323086.1 flocculation protein FLO11 isoform X1 [Rhagoletis pomonella]XP_036323088.1 flocculation protein FLO11 isoform X1 [Rhagoletis pomonella]XP_036323089.1 flocculation protein FLO11 isoform X1 [Rhagoletis pomonella]XP_036323090.1 flocculation protein FLO11 isoform X1 [Rhagoletis pomonella]XP_036323091.1 flocculation protein FLO11 isoform X1 [Rhagoletis pomonella]
MQTAVDCNGSNGSNNKNSNATTTTTIMESSNVSVDACSELLSHDVTPSRSTPAVLLTPVAMLEQTSVLRHRLQVGVGVGHSIGTSAMNYGCPATVGATTAHKVSTPATALIDMAEYMGSNVECMSVTPSPSPQASPSKKAKQNCADTTTTSTTKPIVSHTTINADAAAAASSQASSQCSTSSSNSSSNSSTSSVIASPISIKRDVARRRALAGEVGDGDVGVGVGVVIGSGSNADAALVTAGDILDLSGKDCAERRDALATRGLPLHAAYEEHVTFFTPTTPLSLPSLSSSMSSLSPCTNSTNASTPATSTSLSSTALTPGTNSSKSSPSHSTTKSPAFTSAIQLQHWEDMPKYLQFNPYVLNGYRPLTTFRGCLLSLFYWHNETVNILTHAIPIFYILAIVPGLMPWEQEYRFLSFCHLAGSVAPWCGSFFYHLFMNIDRGEHVYYRLLKLDMVGIWVSQSFGALPLVTATTFCFNFTLKWFIIISYCLLSLWGLYKALTASSPWQRRLCFALPFTMRSILTLFRTIGVWVGGSRLALSHVYLQLEADGVSILGGAIGAMRIPEKWFPGVVDFYLNSHNIMHVLVVVAVYSMHKATIKDFEWMSATKCDAAVANDTGVAIDTTFTSNVEL